MAQHRIKTTHIAQAFVIAPLVPIAIVAIFIYQMPAHEWAGFFALFLMINYIPSLAIGIPFVWFLNARGKMKGRTIIGSGILLGAFTGFALVQLFIYNLTGSFADLEPENSLTIFFFMSLAGIFYSVFISIPFCVIAGVPIIQQPPISKKPSSNNT